MIGLAEGNTSLSPPCLGDGGLEATTSLYDRTAMSGSASGALTSDGGSAAFDGLAVSRLNDGDISGAGLGGIAAIVPARALKLYILDDISF